MAYNMSESQTLRLQRTYRVGLVGAGFAARYHLECLRHIHGVQAHVVAVTSKTERSRRQFAAENRLEAYDDVHSMVQDVDVIVVCSPPYAHDEAIFAAADAGKAIICEKPLTGCFGPADADDSWRGDEAPKVAMLEDALGRLTRIAGAVRASNVFFGYAENFVYAPTIQKEREIIQKTGAQLLRMTGEESHNGSASDAYGLWRLAGGGSLMGKGCHPLTGMLYLKRVEGLATRGRPLRPVAVSARTHQLTRLPGYRDAGFIRTDYHDIEDYGIMHVTFEDGTVCDAISCEVVLGGIYDYIEVFANNHRTMCRLSPTGMMDSFNPSAAQFNDIYTVEKISTKEGWSPVAPDENFTMGYQAEVQDFMLSNAQGHQPQSGLELALDTISTIYAAYVSDSRRGREVDIPLL